MTMQAPFVDLSCGDDVRVLPAHNGKSDVRGERSGSAEFITSDAARGHSGSVLVEWPTGERDWIPIRRVPAACDHRIAPIVIPEEGDEEFGPRRESGMTRVQ